MHPALHGFATGAGLIVAIGAQNVFVLGQGLARNHPVAVAATASAIDAALIALGLAGVGAALAASPVLSGVAALGGALFLAWYGLKSLAAVRSGQSLAVGGAGPRGCWAVVGATIALSLLNPHVYLDTVVLLGTVGSQHAGAGRWLFGLGAAAASVAWFFSLTLGARLAAPLLARPGAWRVFHAAVGAIMLGLAWGLARTALAAWA